MNEHLWQSLQNRAEEVARFMSNPERNRNYNNEVFHLVRVTAISEGMGYAVYRKDPSLKMALCVFFWNESFEKWLSIFPTDAHVLGMSMIPEIKTDIEKYNHTYNESETKT